MPIQMAHVLLLTVLSTSVSSLPVNIFCRPTLVLIFHYTILFMRVQTSRFHYSLMVMVFTAVLNLYGITNFISHVFFAFSHSFSGVLKISLAGANNLVPTTSLTPCIIIIHVYACNYSGAGKNIDAR